MNILLSVLLLLHLIQIDAKAISIPPKSRALLTRDVLRGGSKEVATTSKSSAVTEGLKNTLASGLAAACSKTILAPFDTIKTVQQDVMGGTSLSFVQAVRKICGREGGIGNLYVRLCIVAYEFYPCCNSKAFYSFQAGLGVSVLGSMPSVGLYFGVYSYCKRTISPIFIRCFGSERNDNNKQWVSDRALRTFSIALSAAIGNTVASFSRVPYEVVKQSLQTGQYSSTMQALSKMWQTSGMRSFFPLGSVSIQMVRDIPYAIFTLLSYEYIKEAWVLKESVNDPEGR